MSPTSRQVVAANVRARIAWLDIDKQVMAKRIGLNQQTFSNKTKGIRGFNDDELDAVARELGLPNPSLLFVIPPGFDPPNVEPSSACTRLGSAVTSMYALAS